MKTLFFSLMLMTFGVAAQAGDPNACGMSCCQGAKTMTTQVTQGSCCSKDKAAQAKAKTKATSKDTAAKRPLSSPKALDLAMR